MLDNTRLNESWTSFRTIIEQELDSIVKEKENLNIKLNNVNTLNGVIEECKKDVDTLLSNESLFLEFDPKLEDQFKVLKYFHSENLLDNSLVPATIKAITESQKVLEGLSKVQSLTDKILSLDDKERMLENLKDRSYDRDLIEKLFKKYNVDKETRRYIYLYMINSLGKEVVKRETKQKINIEIAEPKEEENVIETPIEEEVVEEKPVINTDLNSPFVEGAYEQMELPLDNVFDDEDYISNRDVKIRNRNKVNTFSRLCNEYKRITSENERLLNRYIYRYNGLSRAEYEKIENEMPFITEFTRGYYERQVMIITNEILGVKAQISDLMDTPKDRVDARIIQDLALFVSRYESLVNKLDSYDFEIVQIRLDEEEEQARLTNEAIERQEEERRLEEERRVQAEQTRIHNEKETIALNLLEEFKRMTREECSLVDICYNDFASKTESRKNEIDSYVQTLEMDEDIPGVDTDRIYLEYYENKALRAREDAKDAIYDLIEFVGASDFEKLESDFDAEKGLVVSFMEDYINACKILGEYYNIYEMNKKPQTEDKPQNNVFFLADIEGNLIEPELHDYEVLYKPLATKETKTKPTYALINESSIPYNVQVRNKNFAISYVMTNYQGRKAMLVLTVTHLKEGVENLKDETNKLIRQYEGLIKQQLEMISNNNPMYMESQKKIKEHLSSEQLGV